MERYVHTELKFNEVLCATYGWFTYLYLARGMVFLLNIYVFPLSLDKRPNLFDLHTKRVH